MSDDDIDNMDFALPDQIKAGSGHPNPQAGGVPVTFSPAGMQQAPLLYGLPQNTADLGASVASSLTFDGAAKIFHQQLPDPTISKDWACLYPIYFDLSASTSRGRRLARSRATAKDSSAAAGSADESESEKDRSPSRPGPNGTVNGAAKDRRGRRVKPSVPPPPANYPAVIDTMAIQQACHMLRLPAILERKRHPQDHFRWGRVKVKWREPVVGDDSDASSKGKGRAGGPAQTSRSPTRKRTYTYMNPTIRSKRELLARVAQLLPEATKAAIEAKRAIAEQLKRGGHVQAAQAIMQTVDAMVGGAAGGFLNGSVGQEAKQEQKGASQQDGGGGGKKKKGKK